MKDSVKKVCLFCEGLKISKHYDCSTEIRCGKKPSPCFAVAFKSDFSVSPMQVMIAAAATVAIMATVHAVGRKAPAYKSPHKCIQR